MKRKHLTPRQRADLIAMLRLRKTLSDKSLMAYYGISRQVITNAWRETLGVKRDKVTRRVPRGTFSRGRVRRGFLGVTETYRRIGVVQGGMFHAAKTDWRGL